MPSWGNAANNRQLQDMVNWIPGVDNQQPFTMHVNDVNVEDDDKVALKTVNSSTNTDARALKAEGAAEIIGVATGNPATTGLTVLNLSTHSDSKVAEFIGNGDATVQIANLTNDASKKALTVSGNTKMESNPSSDLAHVTLEVENLSEHANAVALKVTGPVNVSGPLNTTGQAVVNGGLQINGVNQGLNIPDINSGNQQSYGVSVTNTSTHASARALRAVGKVELDGVLITSTVSNKHINAPGNIRIGDDAGTTSVLVGRDGAPVSVGGTVTSITGTSYINLLGETRIEGTLEANSGASFPDLIIGSNIELTEHVYLGSGDAEHPIPTTVQGDLTVNGTLNADGALRVGPAANPALIDANNGNHLKIGTGGGTNNVEISQSGKTTKVISDLTVGTATGVGRIDSGGSSAQDLKIGTQSVTASVELGRSGQSVKSIGDLKIGTTSGAGKIDSGASTGTQALKIGSGTATGNVELGRSGQTIDMFAQERLNGNAVILNGASSITDSTARGFKDNPTGFGTGGPSIDFYIGGVVKFYINATGGHNA